MADDDDIEARIAAAISDALTKKVRREDIPPPKVVSYKPAARLDRVTLNASKLSAMLSDDEE